MGLVRGSCCAALALVTATLVASPVSTAAGCSRHSRSERTLLRKMNAARADKDLDRVRLDPELSLVASKHTKEMLAKEKLVHTDGEVLGKRVTNWVQLGENIGAAKNAARLHKLFMQSATHRREILFPRYRFVGIATAKGPDDRLWVTVNFEARKNPGTSLKASVC